MDTTQKTNDLQRAIGVSIADSKPSPFVSVIIPVYNDAARLKVCLEALHDQTYPKSRYEVIVVDNASDQEQNIESLVAQFEQACVTDESTPGSYAARNRGLALAKGEVIAFTDADCIPATDWLEKGVENLLEIPNCGLVAGKVELFFKDLNQPTPIELFESITAFPQQQLLEKYKGAATANVFTFKDVIDRVGLFDANFKSHGDLEWGQRVFKNRYAQTYADSVCVLHPARFSWAQLDQRTRRLAGGYYKLQSKQAASSFNRNRIFIVYLLKNLVPPLMFVFNTFRDHTLEGLKPKIDVCLVMFFVRYVSALEIVRIKLGRGTARG